jgi:hypothetical protein
MNPQYPIYIVSKGRWDSRLTSIALDKLRVPYRIVVEPQEFDKYAAVIDSKKILILPFSNLGQGSIPARNWIWDHSISEGHQRHWIMDDNIGHFVRKNKSERINVNDGTIFRVMEDFVDRYENIALAGPNYRFMIGTYKIPFLANTRIYSCILVLNRIPYRWRGVYNEDTDLSLRVLKDGWCTILFQAFLQDKKATLTTKGGNTDELYQGDGRLKMAQSLQRQHPDVTKIRWKWGRWQHQVNYRRFRGNLLKLKPGITIPAQPNEYGMRLIQL